MDFLHKLPNTPYHRINLLTQKWAHTECFPFTSFVIQTCLSQNS